MNDRLRESRKAAGFVSATSAIDYFKWKGSTYRAHENGQNKFNVEYAKLYGKAYEVNASWLLLGEEDNKLEKENNKRTKSSLKSCSLKICPGQIQRYAVLLQKEPLNLSYVRALLDCIRNYYELLKNKNSF